MLSHCASTMTKPATMAIRAFAIRKARRFLKRDGEWLTEEATDDILDTIEESFGLRYCERSVLNWVAAWICTKIVRPKQQRPWANYKDKGWRKTPWAGQMAILRSLSANNGQHLRPHVARRVTEVHRERHCPVQPPASPRCPPCH